MNGIFPSTLSNDKSVLFVKHSRTVIGPNYMMEVWFRGRQFEWNISLLLRNHKSMACTLTGFSFTIEQIQYSSKAFIFNDLERKGDYLLTTLHNYNKHPKTNSFFFFFFLFFLCYSVRFCSFKITNHLRFDLYTASFNNWFRAVAIQSANKNSSIQRSLQEP